MGEIQTSETVASLGGAEAPVVSVVPAPREGLWLLGILVLAVGLRLPGYTESLWIDELYTSRLFCGDPVILMKTLFSDIHPPAYFLFIHLWSSVFGDGEVFLRLPPLLFGLGTIVLVWRLGDRCGGARVGLMAAFLLAVSPVHIWYSQEARPYSFSMFMMVLVTLLMCRLQERQRGFFASLFYMLAIGALVFTHYYLAAFLVVYAGYAIWKGPTGRKQILISNALVFVALGVYMLGKSYFSGVPTGMDYLGPFWFGEAWRLGFDWFLTGECLNPRDNRSTLGDALLVLIQVLAVLAFLRGIVRLAPRRDDCGWGLVPVVSVLVLPAALFGLTLIGLDQTYIERSALPSLPFFVIVLAAGLSGLPTRFLSGAAFGAAASCCGVVLVAFFCRGDAWTVYKPNPDWRSCAAKLGESLPEDPPPALLYSDYVSPTGLTYYDVRMQEVKNFAPNTEKISALRDKAAQVFGKEGFPGARIHSFIEAKLANYTALVEGMRDGTRLAIYELERNDPMAAESAASRRKADFWLLVHREPSARATALLQHAALSVVESHSFRQLKLYRLRRRD